MRVFFKGHPKDSTKITFKTKSALPFPAAGASQVVIGKYIFYLGGYGENDTSVYTTMYKNISRLDTTTGEYAVLVGDNTRLVFKKIGLVQEPGWFLHSPCNFSPYGLRNMRFLAEVV